MAGVKIEKNEEIWQLFQDYWKILQKYWQPEDNDEYWDAFTAETKEFAKKYPAYKDFSQGLALELIKEMERRTKKE